MGLKSNKLREQKYKTLKILARNIRCYRRCRNISQEQLAEISGLHRTYVGSVERAERNVTVGTLEALADALGVSIVDLLTEKDTHAQTKKAP